MRKRFLTTYDSVVGSLSSWKSSFCAFIKFMVSDRDILDDFGVFAYLSVFYEVAFILDYSLIGVLKDGDEA